MSDQSKTGFKRVALDFMMGGISGAVAKTIAAPIERVKLLLQTQMANPKLAGNPYTGIPNCFYRVATEEGVLAFWRGNMANVIRYFPTQAINFSVKDALSRKFVAGVDPKQRPGRFFFGSLLAGGIAGSIGLLIVYPLDFARTRLGVDVGKHGGGHGAPAAAHGAPAAGATGAAGAAGAAEAAGHGQQKLQFNGLSDCMRQIYATDGIKGLYRGFQISVVGIFVYRALYFGCYDSGKKFVFGDREKDASILARFFFAQAVVSSSETVSYPLDTVRRRLMMQSGRKEVVYSGTIDCFQKIYTKEGVPGFFKGNLSNIWRSVGSSLVLVFYDELQKALTKMGH